MQLGDYKFIEAANHWCLHHPHIISFKEVFTTPEFLALVMEYAPGGSLFSHIKARVRLQEGEARWFFQQLILAVDYMHKAGVINRGIKAENILLDSSPRPLTKLCDFGLSKHSYFQSAPQSRVGALHYLSPEMLVKGTLAPYSGECCDVWACGVVLYIMLVGKYPFQSPGTRPDSLPSLIQVRHGDEHSLSLQKISSVEYSIPASLHISESAQDLLKKIFVADPKARISIPGILHHVWYAEGLPPRAISMNANVLADSRPVKDKLSIEEVVEVLQQADLRRGDLGRQSAVSDFDTIDEGFEEFPTFSELNDDYFGDCALLQS